VARVVKAIMAPATSRNRCKSFLMATKRSTSRFDGGRDRKRRLLAICTNTMPVNAGIPTASPPIELRSVTFHVAPSNGFNRGRRMATGPPARIAMNARAVPNTPSRWDRISSRNVRRDRHSGMAITPQNAVWAPSVTTQM